MSPQSDGLLAASAWCRGWPRAEQGAVTSGDSSARHRGGTEVNSAPNAAFGMKRKTTIN